MEGSDSTIDGGISRRSFLRGSALFAAAMGLTVATGAFAQEPQQKPAEPEKKENQPRDGDPTSETKIDRDGREYRGCPQCGSNMYRQGRTWSCETCGYSYVE